MHEDLNFRRLERFLAVLSAGSVRQAAQTLGMSYQALSVDINALEKALALSLFERSKGAGAVVTPAGRMLEGRIRALLQAGERLEEFAKNIREGREGVISIAAYPVHLERFLARTIQEFSELHPDVSIDLSRVRDDRRRGVGKSLFDELMDGEVHVAMGPPHPGLLGVHGIKAYDARIVALLPEDDPLASRSQVPIAYLKGRRILAAPKSYFSRDRVDRIAADAGFDLNVVHEGSSPPALRALGLAGLGVAVLPDDYTVVGGIERQHPVLIDANGHEVSTPVWLHWREHADDLLAPVETFIDVVRDMAARERKAPRAAAVSL